MNLYDLTEAMKNIGYEPDDARARVCQDVVLKALSLIFELVLNKHLCIVHQQAY